MITSSEPVNKKARMKPREGLGKFGIQSWEPKPDIIQPGSQKPNMGYSQCHMVRNTGQDTNGIMFE